MKLSGENVVAQKLKQTDKQTTTIEQLFHANTVKC